MGFKDKLKKALWSAKKDDVEKHNIIGKTDSIESHNNLNEKETKTLELEDETRDNKHLIDKSFKYLDDLIHNGQKEIILDSDIILNDGEEVEYSAGIKLDADDLIIDGNNHTIDAKGKTRIFKCSAKNVMIKNLVLKNGFKEKTSGAIFNDHGELTVEDSTFIENTAKLAGAIYNNHGELTVEDSTFIENSAKYGGAIDNYYGEAVITDTTFEKNTSEKNGGAIRNWEGELNIINSTFSKSISEAIYNHEGKINIKDSTFEKNTSRAIVNNRGHLNVNLSTFTENTSDSDGGAIYNVKGNLNITESNFFKNTAIWGGAIYNYGEADITNSTFTENTAKFAGAIYNNDKLNIVKCEICANNSSDSIIFNRAFLESKNCKFINNKTKYVLYNNYEKFNISIIGGKFFKNKVEKAVILNKGFSCTLQNTVFEGNLSDDSNNIINCGNLTLIRCEIKDDEKSILNETHTFLHQSKNLENKIYGNGLVESDTDRNKFDFRWLDEKIHEENIKKIVLDHDINLSSHEVFFYEGGIELDVDDLIIDGAGHSIDGGDKTRIFIITANNVTLKNIIFKNAHQPNSHYNQLNISGGTIRINKGNDLTMENCSFINNVCENNQGAIHVKKGKLNISGCEFTHITGGAVYGSDTNLIISDSKFTQIAGEAIKNFDGKLDISDSTFAQNTGQTIYDSHGKLCISNSVFIKNLDIIRSSDGELRICDSTFTENASKSESGIIHIYGGKLDISNSRFTKNTTEKEGGVIHNNGGALNITDSTFIQNTAERNGGSILNDNGDVSIINTEFVQNTAKEFGGVIFNAGGEVNISDSTFDENMANEGGGINNYFGELKLSNTAFTKNTVSSYGGAICNGGELTLTECGFANNAAYKDGSDIFNRSRVFSEEHISQPMPLQNSDEGKFYQLKSLNENQKDFTYLTELISAAGNGIKLECNILLDASGNEYKTYKDGIKIDRNDFIIDGGGHTIDAQGLTRIFEFAGENIQVKNITLKNGFTKFRGGAIHNNGNGLKIINSTFTRNAAHYGGAVYNGQGRLNITECVFAENTANSSGGAIQHYDDELDISNSTFERNASNSDGGAIDNIGGKLNVIDSIFDKNTAKWHGGAIYNVNAKESNIKNCRLSGNEPEDIRKS
ncbi:right-handed parallel beta-helix repeat-containing protein, partial [Methanobrevibacter sp.]|uniref:right-handed parallel beta-helix repeat-containing protein n=1 Tax=Methanobrevibacter sp. TaxID=66852 RepID=UPI00388FD4FC